jgi:SAM-dependent methyltransferase
LEWLRMKTSDKTYIILENKQKRTLPPEFSVDDNRYPEDLVVHFLERFTSPGDRVIDIFAGFGTTLFVAEEMGRVPYGVEIDESKCRLMKSNLEAKENVHNWNSRRLDELGLPPMDFAMSSPPYTRRESGSDPLTAYSSPGTYIKFLDEIAQVYRKLARIMKPGAHIVVEAANLKGEVFTPLAWDLARALSRVMIFEGEVVICWEGPDTENGNYGCGYDHSYCLVFRNSFD